MIMHARLMSSMRASSSEPSAFHYGNLCYWKYTEKSFMSHVHSSIDLPTPVMQLTCRALIQIVQLSRRTASCARVIGKTQKINQESSEICQAYINKEYRRFEQNEFAGSFVDGLDLFAAGVLTICVPSASLLAGNSEDQRIISKCTGLLTSVGGRFSSFKVLPRVLWAMSTVASHGTSSDQVGSIAIRFHPITDFETDTRRSPGYYTRCNTRYHRGVLPTMCGDVGFRSRESVGRNPVR